MSNVDLFGKTSNESGPSGKSKSAAKKAMSRINAQQKAPGEEVAIAKVKESVLSKIEAALQKKKPGSAKSPGLKAPKKTAPKPKPISKPTPLIDEGSGPSEEVEKLIPASQELIELHQEVETSSFTEMEAEVESVDVGVQADTAQPEQEEIEAIVPEEISSEHEEEISSEIEVESEPAEEELEQVILLESEETSEDTSDRSIDVEESNESISQEVLIPILDDEPADIELITELIDHIDDEPDDEPAPVQKTTAAEAENEASKPKLIDPEIELARDHQLDELLEELIEDEPVWTEEAPPAEPEILFEAPTEDKPVSTVEFEEASSVTAPIHEEVQDVITEDTLESVDSLPEEQLDVPLVGAFDAVAPEEESFRFVDAEIQENVSYEEERPFTEGVIETTDSPFALDAAAQSSQEASPFDLGSDAPQAKAAVSLTEQPAIQSKPVSISAPAPAKPAAPIAAKVEADFQAAALDDLSALISQLDQIAAQHQQGAVTLHEPEVVSPFLMGEEAPDTRSPFEQIEDTSPAVEASPFDMVDESPAPIASSAPESSAPSPFDLGDEPVATLPFEMDEPVSPQTEMQDEATQGVLDVDLDLREPTAEVAVPQIDEVPLNEESPVAELALAPVEEDADESILDDILHDLGGVFESKPAIKVEQSKPAVPQAVIETPKVEADKSDIEEQAHVEDVVETTSLVIPELYEEPDQKVEPVASTEEAPVEEKPSTSIWDEIDAQEEDAKTASVLTEAEDLIMDSLEGKETTSVSVEAPIKPVDLSNVADEVTSLLTKPVKSTESKPRKVDEDEHAAPADPTLKKDLFEKINRAVKVAKIKENAGIDVTFDSNLRVKGSSAASKTRIQPMKFGPVPVYLSEGVREKMRAANIDVETLPLKNLTLKLPLPAVISSSAHEMDTTSSEEA